jgi:hypothetical protein
MTKLMAFRVQRLPWLSMIMFTAIHRPKLPWKNQEAWRGNQT